MTILYAWATDAWFDGNVVDHTWVTTYDNRLTPYCPIGDVVAHGESYWYCWGDFHVHGHDPHGGPGALGSAAGDRAIATCIAQPNVETKSHKPAQGTIFRYGRDGVCHQLANQVLYATRRPGIAPLTVDKARGYWLSSFLYGTYGVDDAAWRAKLASCSVAGAAMTAIDERGNQADQFEQRARRLLAGDERTLAALLELRQANLRQNLAPDVGQPVTAEALDARNNRFFEEAARLLGEERYRALFEVPAGQPVRLVDPKQLGEDRKR
jgi:hypothetical protein